MSLEKNEISGSVEGGPQLGRGEKHLGERQWTDFKGVLSKRKNCWGGRGKSTETKRTSCG